jgi:putative transposase
VHVVGKALRMWDSYQLLKDWWESQDDPDGGEPTPPSTERSGAYPLVMVHTEGYRLTVDDDTSRVQVRISPKPYKKVTGHLRGEPDAIDERRDAITVDEVDVGQARLLSRKSKIFDESSKCVVPKRSIERMKTTNVLL